MGDSARQLTSPQPELLGLKQRMHALLESGAPMEAVPLKASRFRFPVRTSGPAVAGLTKTFPIHAQCRDERNADGRSCEFPCVVATCLRKSA